jgi:hypothetical protein
METEMNKENVNNEEKELNLKDEIDVKNKFKKPSIDIEKVEKKREIANTKKQQYITIYEDVVNYCIFNRDLQKKNDYGIRDSKNTKLFNNVGQQAAMGFVNRMQNLLCPIQKDWIKIELGEGFKNIDEGTKNVLQKQIDVINSNLNSIKNTSNFDMVISEFFFDLVFGTACLLIQSMDEDAPIFFQCIPFTDYAITEGYSNFIDGVFRTFNLKLDGLKEMFNDIDEGKFERLKIDAQEDKSLEFIEATIYNYKTKNYDYVVYDLGTKSILVSREYEYNPFIVLRWNKPSNEWYGTGVGQLALNDLKTYNKIMEYSMRCLSFTLPIFLVDRDDILRQNFKIQPGALNPVKYDSNGKPMIQTLQMPTDFNLLQFHLDQIKMDIKRIMLDSTIPDEKQARTATEIQERINELNTSLISVSGRLINEFIYKVPQIMLFTLQKSFNLFPDFKPKQLNYYNYRLEIQTHLTQILNMQDIDNTIRSLQLLFSFDPSGQLANSIVKIQPLLKDLIEKMNIKNDFIYTEEEIQAIQQQQQQQQEQLQQMQMMMQQQQQQPQQQQKPITADDLINNSRL